MEEEASHPTPEGDEPKIEETAEENEPEVIDDLLNQVLNLVTFERHVLFRTHMLCQGTDLDFQFGFRQLSGFAEVNCIKNLLANSCRQQSHGWF